ncbi:MAG: hypothetical protein PHC69_10060, partial [Ruminiclostridium sp.]|nr:hypothetical protein [Ruminiclostridium sp.]
MKQSKKRIIAIVLTIIMMITHIPAISGSHSESPLYYFALISTDQNTHMSMNGSNILFNERLRELCAKTRALKAPSLRVLCATRCEHFIKCPSVGDCTH